MAQTIRSTESWTFIFRSQKLFNTSFRAYFFSWTRIWRQNSSQKLRFRAVRPFRWRGHFSGSPTITFCPKVTETLPNYPPPVVSINIFQILNILNFKVSPNFAKNWVHRIGDESPPLCVRSVEHDGVLGYIIPLKFYEKFLKNLLWLQKNHPVTPFKAP